MWSSSKGGHADIHTAQGGREIGREIYLPDFGSSSIQTLYASLTVCSV